MIIVTNNDRLRKNILTLRQKWRLSQDAFAQLVGMDKRCLDAIEKGTLYEIDAQVLTAICRQFGVDIFSLLEDTINLVR